MRGGVTLCSDVCGVVWSTPASWAAKIAASAWTPSDVSPPPLISADSAPMQPAVDNRGATMAPLVDPGRARTICIWLVLKAAAAALSADRGTVGSLAGTCGL